MYHKISFKCIYNNNYINCVTVILDVNECDLTPAPCKFSCENTEGSFKCFCPTGYVLAPDGITCKGEILKLSVF